MSQFPPDELLTLALMDEHITNRLTPIEIVWNAPNVFIVITALQVARRHPSLDGKAFETQVLAGTIDAVLEDLIQKLKENDMPVSAQIAEAGNDRANDVHRQAPPPAAAVLIHRHCGHYAARDSRGGWSCQKCGSVQRADLVEPAAASKDVH